MQRSRFHHQWSPDKLTIENTVPEEVRAQLQKLGHTLDVKPPAGATNAIMRSNDGVFIGVSEPRLNGKAAGVD
jgi:gamma-glutamyltranspeptidase/glutathione hydrolase